MSNRKKKSFIDDPYKVHDSAMNSIEGTLSVLYDIEFMHYVDSPEYIKASNALEDFFISLSKEKATQ